MLFNLERDTGKEIVGYLVPDGFSDEPVIRVFDDGVLIAEIACDQHREAIMQSGRHATGNIGFRIDEANLPGVEQMNRLAVYDAKSGLLVYRRPQMDKIVRKRVLRLEHRLVPFLKLDRFLDPYFQYAVAGVERFGHETTLQAFHLHAVNSIFISGRLLLRNYEQFFDKGFTAVAMLDEPYHQMADVIFLFSRFEHVPEHVIGERDRMILAPAVEHFADVDITSEKSLRRALKSLSTPVRRILSSPQTRQLVSTYPEQNQTRQSVAAALDTLSRFAVIGLRQRPETFSMPLAEFLQIPHELIPQPVNHSAVAALARRLREVPEAEQLLELDLILYHFAQEAILANWTAGRETAHPGVLSTVGHDGKEPA